MRLTYDHKASDLGEALRVLELGGSISGHQVNGTVWTVRLQLCVCVCVCVCVCDLGDWLLLCLVFGFPVTLLLLFLLLLVEMGRFKPRQ